MFMRGLDRKYNYFDSFAASAANRAAFRAAAAASRAALAASCFASRAAFAAAFAAARSSAFVNTGVVAAAVKGVDAGTTGEVTISVAVVDEGVVDPSPAPKLRDGVLPLESLLPELPPALLVLPPPAPQVVP